MLKYSPGTARGYLQDIFFRHKLNLLEQPTQNYYCVAGTHEIVREEAFVNMNGNEDGGGTLVPME